MTSAFDLSDTDDDTLPGWSVSIARAPTTEVEPLSTWRVTPADQTEQVAFALCHQGVAASWCRDTGRIFAACPVALVVGAARLTSLRAHQPVQVDKEEP